MTIVSMENHLYHQPQVEEGGSTNKNQFLFFVFNFEMEMVLNHLVGHSVYFNKSFLSQIPCEQTLEEESAVTLFEFETGSKVNLYSSSIISTLMIQWVLTGSTEWAPTNNPLSPMIKVMFFSQEGMILHSLMWINGFIYHSSLGKFNLRKQSYPITPISSRFKENGFIELWVTFLSFYKGGTICFFEPLSQGSYEDVVRRIGLLEGWISFWSEKEMMVVMANIWLKFRMKKGNGFVPWRQSG